jgi:acyl-CoA synthetase (AMP-forming)/AMP-acid ligase II
MQTLADAFLRLSDETEKGIIIIKDSVSEEFIPYSQVYLESLKFANWLRSIQITKGDYLIFQINDIYNFILIFWASIISGIIPVPLNIANNEEDFDKLVNVYKKFRYPSDGEMSEDCGFERINIITDSMLFREFLSKKNNSTDDWLLKKIENSLRLFDNNLLEEASCEIFFPNPQDVAYIQFSSGSTGEPKGIVLSHENLCTNINSIIKGIFETDKNDSCISWLPLTHDMGLIGFHLTPIFKICNHYLMPPSLFVRNPGLWFKLIEKHRISVLSSTTFGLNYMLNHAKKREMDLSDLSCIKLIFCGAEWVDPDVCSEFESHFQLYKLKPGVVFPVYGLAEASLAVSFPKLDNKMKTISIKNDHSIGKRIELCETADALEFCSVGYPMDNCEIDISDENNASLDERIVGYIRVKGKNVTGKYFNDPALSEKIISKDGWLNTGDIGFIADHELFIIGRNYDFISLNGRNIFLSDVEKIISSVNISGGNEIVTSSYFDKKTRQYSLLVFIKYQKSLTDFLPVKVGINMIIKQKFGINAEEIIPVKRFYKTSSGKVQRYKLLNGFLNGTYEDVRKNIKEAERNNDLLLHNTLKTGNMTEFLKCFIDSEFGIKNISLDDNLFNFGINSIHAIIATDKLRLFFPEKEISVTTLFTYTTIRELSTYLHA